MNQPTHDEIAQKAQALWKDRGCPEGIDNVIWLEAERELRGGQSPGSESAAGFTHRVQTEAAAESRDEFHMEASTPEQQAIKAAVQPPPARSGKKDKGRSSTGSVKGGSGQSGLG